MNKEVIKRPGSVDSGHTLKNSVVLDLNSQILFNNLVKLLIREGGK
jgi:hypothetical protein